MGDGDMSNSVTFDESLRELVSDRAHDIYKRAHSGSSKKLEDCRAVINSYLVEKGLPSDQICFVAVGSVGRYESLDSSDLDLIPILGTLSAEEFQPHDLPIREKVTAELAVKVSKGEDLTKFQQLSELTNAECIGGDRDESSALTKRVLILTEGAEAGGTLPLDAVRRPILDAYAKEARTRGRHLLTLNNDIARYYRTLCIEYKAKIDVEGKDWCTRNVKLRHSRKFWYFSAMLGLADQARRSAEPRAELVDRVLDTIRIPPWGRLIRGLGSSKYAAGKVLEPYAWFLDFMASKDNREALAKVSYDDRYSTERGNPFPAMKANSDLMHREMITLLDTLDRPTRDRVLDWFLL